MEDRDSGRSLAGAGVESEPEMAGFSRPFPGALDLAPRAPEPRASAVPAAGGRQTHQRPGDAGPGGATQPKRRRRRRGRKAFVRDRAGAAPALPAPPMDPGPAQHEAQRPAIRPMTEAPAPVAPGDGQRPPKPQPVRSSRDLPVFAALDLGTNNCRLLVAVPARPGQFRVVDAFSRIVRLGEGLSRTGRLGEPAMDRAVEALKVCGDKLRARPHARARLIATEACRSAVNGTDFLARVEAEAGIRLEIIDRETEARLAVSGCGSLVDDSAAGAVLFDIGGGSTEIALVELGRRRRPRLSDNIVDWTSLPIGVVSLAERFGGRLVTRESFAGMVDHVGDLLEGFAGRGRLDHLRGPGLHLLGTSGTVTTLAGLHLELERYDRRRVDGLWMESGTLDLMVEKLLGWTFEQRVANPCIGPDRADLVLAGCAILQAIRAVWPAERLRVADRGLREGMLSELMLDAGVWGRPGGPKAGRS